MCRVFVELMWSVYSAGGRFFLVVPLVFCNVAGVFLLVFDIFYIVFYAFTFAGLSLEGGASVYVAWFRLVFYRVGGGGGYREVATNQLNACTRACNMGYFVV